jgi:trans-aconitate methyltransferase
MEDLLEQYGPPPLSIDQLVIEINKIFHAFDAEIYDNKHREIYEQLPSIWKEMNEKVTESFKSKALRILDFGCGTGFEAQQLLRNIPINSIAGLTCYDPSPEMLEKCRKAISPLFPRTIFSSSLEEALTPIAPYTLLVTNSVLHHLPDVTSMVRNLLPCLGPNAMWLVGH